MKAFIVFAMLLCASTASFADNDSGLYAGAGVGVFNVKTNGIDGVEDIGPFLSEFDSDDTSFKIFGGWRFSRYISAELAYIDFGGPDDDVNGTNVKAEIDGFAPYIVGTLPLGPLELFAKAGYLFYDLNVKVSGDRVGSASGNDEDFIYGAGIGITIFGHLNAQLEYEIIDVSEVDDANAIWLSGAWRF